MSEQRFITPREAADILGVTMRTIYKNTRNGKIPSKKVGVATRIPLSWIESHGAVFSPEKGQSEISESVEEIIEEQEAPEGQEEHVDDVEEPAKPKRNKVEKEESYEPIEERIRPKQEPAADRGSTDAKPNRESGILFF